MSSVDNRVVNMIFDNQKFEQGIQTSVKSLNTLKQSLQLEGATKGLHDIDKSARGITFATLTNGVESIAVKFSTLGVVAVTALQNITNSLYLTGKQLVSSLTIDPIIEGFREYELKMDSVQNIMNGTGETLERVSSKLDELNTYADRTIYSFSDMTSNIGKFTNAGVGLDEAVGAIQGVANAAALSGSNATQASHAMYNFAQALASGHIKLIDWKSIENANMATVEFKSQLLESAVAAGTLTKSADGMYTVLTKNGTGSNMKETISATKNFNDSLAYQWMTTEVLIGTLNDYADETTEIGKRAFKAATEVKTFTQLIDTMQEAVGSGWAETWELIIGNFDEAKEVLTEISQAFEKVIDSSANARNDMLSSWKELGGRTAIIDGLRNTIHGLISVIKPIKDAFRDIFPPITAERLVSLSEGFRDFTSKLKLSKTASDNLKSTFKGLFAIIDIGKDAFFAAAKAVSAMIEYILPAGDGVLALTGSFGDFVVAIRDAIKESDVFNKVFEKLGKVIQPVADLVKGAIESIVENINSFRNVDTSGVDNLGQRVEKGFRPFIAIANLLKGAFDIIALTIKKVSPLFAGLGMAIGKGLGTAQKSIMDWLSNVDFSRGLDIFNAGIFATLLLGARKFIDKLTSITDNAEGIIEGFKSIFGGITGTFEALQSRLKADTLIKIAGAIAILTASIVVLSMVDSAKLTIALTAITVLFTELFASMTIFQKIMDGPGFKSMGKISVSMLALSAAVLILSAAMKKMANLDWAGLSKGLIGIAGSMGLLIASLYLMPNTGKVMKGAGGLILFATSINVLAGAVKKFGDMETDVLKKGLVGVGVILTELALFMRTTDLDGMGVLRGTGLVIFATSLHILSSAVNKIGSIDTNEMIKGLAGIAGLLAGVAIFINTTGDAKRVTSHAVGLTILATSMIIFTQAIRGMGGMSWEEIAKGLTTMGGALLIITTSLHFIQGALGGAMALITVAGALAILTPVLKVLGNMSLGEIGSSLLVLAGTFAVLGVSAALLTPVIPSLLGLAGAITLLGISVTLIGGGIFALSAGITALGIAGSAGVGALVLAVTGLIGLIPMFIQQIARGLIAFANVIGDGGPAIIKALTTIFTSLAEAFIVSTPMIITAALTLLNALLDALIDFIPRLVDGGMQLVLGILQGIEDNIGEIVKSAINIVVNFIDGISSMLPDVIQSAFGLMISFIDGLAVAIEDNTQTVVDSMLNLMSTIVKSSVGVLKEKVSSFVDAGKDLIRGFIDGIREGLNNVREAAKDVGIAAINGVKGILKIQSPSKVFKDEIGKNIGAGLIQGLNAITPNVTKESANLGSATMTGTAEGIRKNSSKVINAASNTAESTYQATKEWIDKQRKYYELSLDQEYSKWESIQNKYKEGSQERLDIELRMREIQQQKIKEQHDFSKKWIDEEKYYKRLSLEEELAAWERVHERYKNGTKEQVEYAKQAAKEIFRVKSEILRDEFNQSKKWIDEEKFYKRLSLVDELAAWERVHERYKNGSKEEVEFAKEAARNIFTIKQQLNDKLMSAEEKYHDKVRQLNERTQNEIQALWDKYDNAVESRYQSLMGTFGLFDKVEISDTPVSGQELVSNLEGQVQAFEDWKSEINILVEKGVSESMIEELKKMGPKSLEQIKALNQLTGPELQKYSDLFREKSNLARSMATEEMEGMRRDTQYQVSELRRQTREQLRQYRADWDYEISQITATVHGGFDQMLFVSKIQMDGFKHQTVEQMQETTDGMKTVIEDQDWEGIGSNIIKGIQGGVSKQSGKLIGQMMELAIDAMRAVNRILGIRSPSREFAKIGSHVVDGFIVGIQNGSNSIQGSMESMANNALSTMQSAMSKISDVLNSDMNLSPVIRPILDLDDIQLGSKQIDDILQPSLNLDKIHTLSENIPTRVISSDTASTPKASNVSFVQNNYSPKALSRIDIYRQTRNQISTMKGVLNNV